jgi:DNA-binding MarR family transcriptional regulator/GNAT superfamily N-acetyltransferase
MLITMPEVNRNKPSPRADARTVADVRDFNRFYTRQLGLLDRRLLDSSFTLTEARVLYELAQRQSSTATEIAADLGLDLGYLSRILKKFERHGLIKRARMIEDTRRIQVGLTPAGRKRFFPLDRVACRQIESLIAPLTTRRRNELLNSMRAIKAVLAAPKSATDSSSHPHPLANALTLRDLRPGDIGWITHRQAVLYHQEYGWDGSYEALVAEILSGFVKSFDPDSEAAWIAEADEGIVGSVFLVHASPKIAKLRLLYVEPTARGMGIGRTLVDECIAFARAKHYETLTLWTNDVLVSARKIYQAAGFRLTKEEPHRSFGKDLVGQTWDLALKTATLAG